MESIKQQGSMQDILFVGGGGGGGGGGRLSKPTGHGRWGGGGGGGGGDCLSKPTFPGHGVVYPNPLFQDTPTFPGHGGGGGGVNSEHVSGKLTQFHYGVCYLEKFRCTIQYDLTITEPT